MILLVLQRLVCWLVQRQAQMSLMLLSIVSFSQIYPALASFSPFLKLGMSGLTSQPSMGAVCGALEQTSLGTGIRYEDIQALNLYWSQVRILYGCFEANVRASDSSVFDHEMPGGQYTNLMVNGCDFSKNFHLMSVFASSSKPPNLVSAHNGQVTFFYF